MAKYWQVSPKSNNTTQYPRLWYPQCEYCRLWDNAHEKEVLNKAEKLCKTDHWLDWVKAGLDLLDHSNCNNISQMQFLLKIHNETGCSCLDDLAEQVFERTQDTSAPQRTA